jgi:DNA polymerase eta
MQIAVNYPAREFGIKRMTKIKDAKQMCPNLVVVHVATYKDGENEPKYHLDPETKTHKVSLDLYRRESIKIINIFKSTLPTAEVGEWLLTPCLSEVLRTFCREG